MKISVGLFRGVGVPLVALAMALGVGCSHFQAKPDEKYVYVTSKQTFLRDRVAAVSNRTGTANNGEKLVVLEHARRFLKVRTPRGEVGWIEEKLTAGQEVADAFDNLGKQHEKDPVVAKAVARDEVYLHLTPGRETERFYRLAEGDALSLLQRATVVKGSAGAASVVMKATVNAAGKPTKSAVKKPVATPRAEVAPVAEPGPGEVLPEVVMEDWWLVRDAKNQTGWIYARMIDVSTPDTLARYSEGQRVVAAYVLGYADDPDSGMVDNGNPVTRIPEYVTVLSAYKAGLPYDFDQVRVFTWNTKKHRYETAMREKNVAGYLPVTIDQRADPYSKAANATEKLPSFTYKVLAADQAMPVPDPISGTIKPGRLLTKTYRLEGNLCRRLVVPGAAVEAEAHPVAEVKKEKGKGKKK